MGADAFETEDRFVVDVSSVVVADKTHCVVDMLDRDNEVARLERAVDQHVEVVESLRELFGCAEVFHEISEVVLAWIIPRRAHAL